MQFSGSSAYSCFTMWNKSACNESPRTLVPPQTSLLFLVSSTMKDLLVGHFNLFSLSIHTTLNHSYSLCSLYIVAFLSCVSSVFPLYNRRPISKGVILTNNLISRGRAKHVWRIGLAARLRLARTVKSQCHCCKHKHSMLFLAPELHVSV